MFFNNLLKSELTIVFEGSPLDANFIRSILEENDIPSLSKENLKGQLYPLYVTYGWIKPIKVYVEKKYEQKAREIINNTYNQ
jgi:hypothetical protein